jgi:urease subunit gamma/beta
MNLTPREQERLLVSVAGMVARDRQARGVKLNHPEAIALLTCFVLEGARDGRTVADLMDAGRRVLTAADCMDGVPELVPEVQVEATFPDGTKLVTLHSPIPPSTGGGVVPGEVLVGEEPVDLFGDAALLSLLVVNAGDRPIQVGSHYHFAEANPALSFDRTAARGHRLAIPAGTSVRFEPGIDQTVELVPIGGGRVVAGLRGEVAGPL